MQLQIEGLTRRFGDFVANDAIDLTIEPGENLTLIAAPQASANSVVTVTVRMETIGGTMFGAPVAIDITATELGRVAWIIIFISGAVVLGGTVWRIRAVQAERSKEDA